MIEKNTVFLAIFNISTLVYFLKVSNKFFQFRNID